MGADVKSSALYGRKYGISYMHVGHAGHVNIYLLLTTGSHYDS